MLDDEQRKVAARAAERADHAHLGRAPTRARSSSTDSPATLRKTKQSLTKPEVLAVSNRLNSLQTQLPIPKGIDPMKARPQRGKMR